MKSISRIIIVSIYIFILIPYSKTDAQAIYQDLDSPIYNFLDRVAVKGLVRIPSESKPFTRKQIAGFLFELMKKNEKLNKIEIEELNWYQSEYKFELNKIDPGLDIADRIRAFSYTDSITQLQGSPVAGYGISKTGNFSGRKRWWGASIFGTYSEWFGIQVDMRDHGEFQDNVNKTKFMTPETGFDFVGAPNGIEYSDVRGSVNLDFGIGSIALRKDYNKLGSGKFGNLILSDKPASYTHIKLDFQPFDWLRFHYIYGWLHSGVIDSSDFYRAITETEITDQTIRYAWVDKYYVANLLTVSPWKFLDVSLGNSIVYSGDSRPEMFIPFLFFK